MKTPQTTLYFTQQSWWAGAKRLQRLQADVSAAGKALGIAQLGDCALLLDGQNLQLQTSAALATRVRQIEPELKNVLNQNHWNLQSIEIKVQRSAASLSKHLPSATKQWTNPNELRLGKRTVPSAAQKTLLAAFMPAKRRAPTTRLPQLASQTASPVDHSLQAVIETRAR